MPIDFYYLPPSPPCRVVMLLAKALDVKLDLKVVNILAGEHLTPEYIKLNPQHTIPTLNDNGLILWESRAILGYLVDQYGKDDSLYPKDPAKRAMVNQRLYFDIGTLYQRILEYYVPVLFRDAAPDEAVFARIEEAVEYLNTFLEGQEWVAGENITIADYSISVSLSNAEAFGLDISKFPNVYSWYEKTKIEIAGFDEINQTGADVLGQMFKSKLT